MLELRNKHVSVFKVFKAKLDSVDIVNVVAKAHFKI